MTHEQFIKHINRQQKQIQNIIRNKLPRQIGKIAVDHFKQNFIRSGFVDNGLQKWQKAKRIDMHGKYAAQKYGTLLSARKELYNSITYDVKGNTIIISSDKEYAQIHNEGGTLQITNTHKVKRFFWHMYKANGQMQWKYMVLSKKPLILLLKCIVNCFHFVPVQLSGLTY